MESSELLESVKSTTDRIAQIKKQKGKSGTRAKKRVGTLLKHMSSAIAKDLKKRKGGTFAQRMNQGMAIATAQLQDYGYMKKGTHSLTAKGSQRDLAHRQEPHKKSSDTRFDTTMKKAKKTAGDYIQNKKFLKLTKLGNIDKIKGY